MRPHIEEILGTISMMSAKFKPLRARALSLRRRGKTYGDIQRILGQLIPKSTLSSWCSGILLSRLQREGITKRMREESHRGRMLALLANKQKRDKYIKSVKRRVSHLRNIAQSKDIAKIVAAMLYLGEGAKNIRGSLMFGNSNPEVVRLFLRTLRHAYDIDESKFRCTLQCRADQDIKELEKFWSRATNISLRQFYKARIDPRTIGKPSVKQDYKGVCRIDYFSGDLYTELKVVAETMM